MHSYGIFSHKVSISISTMLIGGGITIAVATTGIPIWAWVCWGLAIAYLLATIAYHLTQIIVIDVSECLFCIGSTPQNLMVAVGGFIYSRHPTALIELQLCLLGWRIGAVDRWSTIPDTINAVGVKFRAVYNVSCDEFQEGRIDQLNDKAIDIGKICVNTKGGCYLSEPFVVPGGGRILNKESWYRKMKKQTVSKKLKEREECITRKELHNLLNKASKPIKKSEKGKS